MSPLFEHFQALWIQLQVCSERMAGSRNNQPEIYNLFSLYRSRLHFISLSPGTRCSRRSWRPGATCPGCTSRSWRRWRTRWRRWCTSSCLNLGLFFFFLSVTRWKCQSVHLRFPVAWISTRLPWTTPPPSTATRPRTLCQKSCWKNNLAVKIQNLTVLASCICVHLENFEFSVDGTFYIVVLPGYLS